MDDELYDREREVLALARAAAESPGTDFRAAFGGLVGDYERLLKLSRRIERVGKTLERQRLVELESKNRALEELNRSYARFIPREILDLLLKKSVTEIELGDHVELEMAVLFADIRNFTAMSESLPATDVFLLLNTYLGAVSPILRAHGGIVDKYLGDGVMAIFPDSSEEALLAALEVQKALRALNEGTIRPRFGHRLEVGIGIHQGTCILGTIGDSERMDTTVIADAVNVASRIEGLTKLYNCPVLISQDLFRNVIMPDNFLIRFVDCVKIRGKHETVTIFEAVDLGDCPPERLRYFDEFERAVMRYHGGDFDAARSRLAELVMRYPGDQASRIYLERCDKEGLSAKN